VKAQGGGYSSALSLTWAPVKFGWCMPHPGHFTSG